MGASITLAGESLIAQKQGAQQILTVSRFILANVPGLDPSGPVDRAAGKPAAGQIVGTYNVTDAGYVPQDAAWLTWMAFAFTLYAGLTMVTNIPFYSFKDVNFRKTVPFIVIVAIALGIAVITIHPPIVLFGVFVVYGLSGYGVYAWKLSQGKRVSVISTSTDEPEEAGLHR